MKQIIALLLTLPFLANSQDTIFKKDNTNIYCKITKVTSSMIFYTENKVGKSISMADVLKHTFIVTNTTPLNSNKTSKGKEFAADCSKLEYEHDKFDGTTRISTKSQDDISFVKIFPLKNFNNDTAILMKLKTVSTEAKGGSGAIILLSDGSKLEYPDAKIEIGTIYNTQFLYTAVIPLRKSDYEKLSNNFITDYRLYIFDKSISEKYQQISKSWFNCILKAK